MKTCFICKQTKPAKDFYKHPMMGDGRLGKCAACCRAYERARRKQFPEIKSAYEAKRWKTPKRKRQIRESAYRRRKKHPEKTRAYNKVHWAIKTGRIKRLPCEVCGTTKMVQAHHDDYFKPLDVRWLCFKHHREVAHGQRVVKF